MSKSSAEDAVQKLEVKGGEDMPPGSTELKLKPSDYVHLHNHSHYSILDGLQKIPEMVQKTKEMGMEAIAVTDHGTMASAIELYKKGKAEGIKPIIGSEFYVAARKHTDKDKTKDRPRFHLILIAMNQTGYKNLCKLSTISWSEGYYFKPRIDHELLEKFNEGIICLSGCIGGEVGDALRNGNISAAKKAAQIYKKIFGDRYYLELQDHGHRWDEQKKVNEHLLSLSKELDIPAVVTCDAHYLEHADQDVHEVLLCVATASNLDQPGRFSLKDTDLFLTDPKDLIERWGTDHPELILNTKKVADRCNLEFELGKILIPKFETTDGLSEKDSLHRMVWQGLAWRYGGISEPDISELDIKDAIKTLPKGIKERAKYELGVISDMGFNGYFLIVQDFIIWGKNQGIIFGPGRGSAAGSVVAYSLKITELDPLKYGLLFERFLNPDRISMPDIDIDIQDSRRGEVIQYCVEKYGKERVANIGTYGIMAARAAVRDVGRVLGIPLPKVDKLAKLIPPPVQGRHVPLKTSLKDNSDLKNAYQDSEYKQILDVAVRLEGTIRNNGVHAAGVVIAPTDITDYAPLYKAPSGVMATQYTMNPVEDLGLLKMDFLGLSNLTIINNALKIIKRVYEDDIDIDTIPLDDEHTFKLLQRADTTGVFQLESDGMRKYLRRLKPDRFEDIVAMAALYRPGPLSAGLVDKFIDRKLGLEEVEYDHPTFEKVYKETFGVLVYQEQFMAFAREICGFSGGESDTLRKAVGKKKIDVLKPLEKRYVEGGIEHSKVPKEVMEKSWQDLLGFADYCFNKSHSACYALIAYQTAYLKAHYPDAFMAALMTSDADNIDRLTIDISECKKIDLSVQNPDINESFSTFAIVKGRSTIRFGLGAIKNVGQGAAESIIKEREKNGKFKSIEDFFVRVNSRQVNKRAIESLIKTGGFDSFSYHRSDLFEQIQSLIAFSQKRDKEAISNQVGLFGAVGDQQTHLSLVKSESEAPDNLKLGWERDLLGLYLSFHPLDKYREYFQEHVEIISGIDLEEVDGGKGIVGGIVIASREIITKKGDKMAFVKLEDTSSEIELVVFPQSYAKHQGVLQKSNAVIAVSGKFDAKDRDGNLSDDLKMIVDEISEVTEDHLKTNQKPKFGPPKPSTYGNSRPNNYAPKPPLTPKSPAPQTPPNPSAEENPKPKPAPQSSKDSNLIYIKVVKPKYEQDLLKLKSLSKAGAETSIVLVFGEKPAQRALKLPFKLNLTPELKTELASIFGSENLNHN